MYDVLENQGLKFHDFKIQLEYLQGRTVTFKLQTEQQLWG